MSTITTGMDLAQSVFSVCEVDGSGRVLRRQDLRRDAFSVCLAKVPAGTVVQRVASLGAVLSETRLATSADGRAAGQALPQESTRQKRSQRRGSHCRGGEAVRLERDVRKRAEYWLAAKQPS